jgi:hypothetical protein
VQVENGHLILEAKHKLWEWVRAKRDRSVVFPQKMEVDDVRVWQRGTPPVAKK